MQRDRGVFDNMDLHIFGKWDAQKFQPTKPTYAIRIFSSYSQDFDKKPLAKSPLYHRIVEQTFDDIWPDYPGVGFENPIMFTEEMADSIIRDFSAHKDSIDALLVHCSRGMNRSPAVGLALNEIFNLGYNPDELKTKYPDATWFVYRTLKEVAGKLSL